MERHLEEVDPPCCRRCGHQMRIVSLIHEPAVMALQRYLCHEQQFPFRTPKGGTVIPCLNPFNHSKEFLDTKNPQRQHAL